MRNIYEHAMWALTHPLSQRDFISHVGDVIEAGADGDLLFALLQMCMTIGRDLMDTNYLLAACGRRGADSAVSLLLQLGLITNVFTPNVCLRRNSFPLPRVTPLRRAVRWKRVSAIRMLFRRQVIVGERMQQFFKERTTC